MKKIVLDVDGVLLSFMPSFDKAAAIVLNKDICVQKDEYQMDYYHLAKRVGATTEQVNDILQYMQDSKMYASLAALEGVKESLEAIREAGYKIYVVTALPETAKEMRLENLKNVLDFVPDEIHCVGMGKSKKDALLTINPDIFVDDRIEYLASAPHVYHLVWCDQKEAQHDKESMISVHVHSLKEWVDNYMPEITNRLNSYYNDSLPLQVDLKLENVSRKYKFR